MKPITKSTAPTAMNGRRRPQRVRVPRVGDRRRRRSRSSSHRARRGGVRGYTRGRLNSSRSADTQGPRRQDRSANPHPRRARPRKTGRIRTGRDYSVSGRSPLCRLSRRLRPRTPRTPRGTFCRARPPGSAQGRGHLCTHPGRGSCLCTPGTGSGPGPNTGGSLCGTACTPGALRSSPLCRTGPGRFPLRSPLGPPAGRATRTPDTGL